MSATIVVDLGFGDAGKGSIVDYLTRRSERVAAVVRFNGGAQAAHNVVTPDGVHHTFAQFGSGTLAGARTHLSRFMLIDPPSMMNEARHLEQIGVKEPFAGLTVDEDCLVVTLCHKLLNRHRETERGENAHGTCGMGIGEAMAMSLVRPDLSIRASHLGKPKELARRLYRQFDYVISEIGEIGASLQIEHLNDLQSGCRLNIVGRDYLGDLAEQGDLIFEGAQGVLLDETYGFHPYTTWSTCTTRNALTLLDEIGYSEPVTRIGVLRSYMCRHGAGPFPTENRLLGKALKPEVHNTSDSWQGKFRVGNFDAVLGRYAIQVCGGVDEVAITNLDRFGLDLSKLHDAQPYFVASAYRYDHPEEVRTLRLLRPLSDPSLRAQAGLTRFVSRCSPEYKFGYPVAGANGLLALIEAELEVPVMLTSFGPTANDKHQRY